MRTQHRSCPPTRQEHETYADDFESLTGDQSKRRSELSINEHGGRRTEASKSLSSFSQSLKITTKPTVLKNTKWGTPVKPKEKIWASPVRPQNKTWGSPKQMDFPRVRSESEPNTPLTAFSSTSGNFREPFARILGLSGGDQISRPSSPTKQKLQTSSFSIPNTPSTLKADISLQVVGESAIRPWGYNGDWPRLKSPQIKGYSYDDALSVIENSSQTRMNIERHLEVGIQKRVKITETLDDETLKVKPHLTINTQARMRRRQDKGSRNLRIDQGPVIPSSPLTKTPRSATSQIKNIVLLTDLSEYMRKLKTLLPESKHYPVKELQVHSNLLISLTALHGHFATPNHLSALLSLSEFWFRQGNLDEAFEVARHSKRIVLDMMVYTFSLKGSLITKSSEIQELCEWEAKVDKVLAALVGERVRAKLFN